ncbi:MAG TPA: hypothetical protein VK325_11710 [Pseudoxanthomonas sp.]|nr:hypothetical protein [Pseudoxanthomonas sp.]
MANRSYLYASDRLPGSPEWEAKRELHGIAEWNYDIPLTFKLLLSGNPRPVRSSIWDTEEEIALAGDAQAGLLRLQAYLARLPPQAAELAAEAQGWLSRPSNVRRYFVLECGEIFDMEDEDFTAQNLALLAEIQALSARLDSLPVPALAVASADTGSKKKGGFLERFLGRPEPAPLPNPLAPFHSLGLGNCWSDALYHDFADDDN